MHYLRTTWASPILVGMCASVADANRMILVSGLTVAIGTPPAAIGHCNNVVRF
jgi:hypothetical protein